MPRVSSSLILWLGWGPGNLRFMYLCFAYGRLDVRLRNCLEDPKDEKREVWVLGKLP